MSSREDTMFIRRNHTIGFALVALLVLGACGRAGIGTDAAPPFSPSPSRIG